MVFDVVIGSVKEQSPSWFKNLFRHSHMRFKSWKRFGCPYLRYRHKLKSQDCIPSCHQSHIKNSNCVLWTSWIKISCHGQLTVIPTQVSPWMPQYETTQALSSLAKTETDLEVCTYSHQEQSSIRLHASTGHQDPTIEVQCSSRMSNGTP